MGLVRILAWPGPQTAASLRQPQWDSGHSTWGLQVGALGSRAWLASYRLNVKVGSLAVAAEWPFNRHCSVRAGPLPAAGPGQTGPSVRTAWLDVRMYVPAIVLVVGTHSVAVRERATSDRKLP